MGLLLKIRIIAARNLPIMDTLSQSTDAYVTISLGGLPSSRSAKDVSLTSSYVSSAGVTPYLSSRDPAAPSDRAGWSSTSNTSASTPSTKSGVITKTHIDRRTLNPVWNHDFRYELASTESLQDYTLDFKVWDHDYVSSDDIIGSVVIVIDCASLRNRSMEGWFPIWDTVKGMRGELHLSIRVESLGNMNPWKEDSENVRIYSCKDLRVFEELGGLHSGQQNTGLGNNNASSFRSGSFTKHTALPYNGPILGDIVEELLVDRDHTWMDTFRSTRTSNEQRQQLFYTLSGRMRRKIGKKAREMGYNAVIGYRERFDLDKEENGITVRAIGTMAYLPWLGGVRPLNAAFPYLGGAAPHMLLDQSGSEHLAESPHSRSPHHYPTTGSWNGSPTKYSPTKHHTFPNVPNPNPTPATWKNADIKLCTMKQFERFRIKRLGGLVTAKSVKLSNKTEKNRKQLGKIHDSWWHELRDEIKSHARMLHCSHVIGYEENMYIYRDVCVLWASGTAAVLRVAPKRKKRCCKLLHVPYPVGGNSPFGHPQNADDTSVLCDQCERFTVPELLLSSIETPEEIITRGESVFIEAHVIRKKKKKSKDEELATYISNLLVFIEFDLHKQLCYKLKLYGMNMAMNYKMDMAICQDSIVFTCSVQAFRSIALPKPTPLEFNRIKEVQDSEDVQMLRVQQHLERISVQNIRKTDHASTSIPIEESDSETSSTSSDDEREDDRENDPSVVEIHDDTDEDQMACLLASAFPAGVQVSSLASMVPHGTQSALSNFQHIVLTKRFELDAPLDKINQHLTALYNDMYRELAYRMEPFVPCLLAGIQNKIEFFDRELQIQTSAQAILLNDLEEGGGLSGAETEGDATTDTDTEGEKFEELRPLLLDGSMTNIYQSLYHHFKEQYLSAGESKATTQTAITGAITSLETPVNEEIFHMDTHHDGGAKGDALPKVAEPQNTSSQQPYHAPSSSTVSSNLDSLDELLKTTTSFYSKKDSSAGSSRHLVHVTPLWFVPGYRVKKLHNRIYIHFLREADNVTDPSSFLEDVYCDMKNIIQARTRAERANAILGFEIFEHNVVVNRGHKQAFLTCSGDIAVLEPIKSLRYEHLEMGMDAISSIGATLMQ